MRRLLFLIAIFVSLATPAQAADTFTPTVAQAHQIDGAKAIAARVWKNPCANGVSVTWGPVVPTATTVNTDEIVAEATQETCSIVFNNTLPVPRWTALCTYMIHEYGHLAGYRDPSNVKDPFHSANPKSIMRPDARIRWTFDMNKGRWFVTNTDKRCALPAH